MLEFLIPLMTATESSFYPLFYAPFLIALAIFTVIMLITRLKQINQNRKWLSIVSILLNIVWLLMTIPLTFLGLFGVAWMGRAAPTYWVIILFIHYTLPIFSIIIVLIISPFLRAKGKTIESILIQLLCVLSIVYWLSLF